MLYYFRRSHIISTSYTWLHKRNQKKSTNKPQPKFQVHLVLRRSNLASRTAPFKSTVTEGFHYPSVSRVVSTVTPLAALIATSLIGTRETIVAPIKWLPNVVLLGGIPSTDSFLVAVLPTVTDISSPLTRNKFMTRVARTSTGRTTAILRLTTPTRIAFIPRLWNTLSSVFFESASCWSLIAIRLEVFHQSMKLLKVRFCLW